MERREADVERDPTTAHVSERREVVSDPRVEPMASESSSEVVSSFNPAWRAVQAVYVVFGIICGVLLIRMVLKLLGANPLAAFAQWTYSVTDFFLGPFHNLLPTIGNTRSQLEMSVVVAILVYALIGMAAARIVEIILYKNVTVARRSGLRPRGY